MPRTGEVKGITFLSVWTFRSKKEIIVYTSQKLNSDLKLLNVFEKDDGEQWQWNQPQWKVTITSM